MTKNTITLPNSKDVIPYSEIPWLIAKAITPAELVNTVKITAILKRYIPEDMPYDEEMISEAFPPMNLTVSDWGYLNLACCESELPPIRQNNVLRDILLSDWEPYEKAFKDCMPGLQLHPLSSTTLKIVENQHRIYLYDAILKKEVVVYDRLTHIPLQRQMSSIALENAYMTVSDFTSYAKQFNLAVLVGNADEQENISDTNVLQKIPVAKQQNDAILTWLKDNKYDPKALPIPPQGKSGVKKLCRDKLRKNIKLFSSDSVFNTAWDRLRKDKEIQDEKTPTLTDNPPLKSGAP